MKIKKVIEESKPDPRQLAQEVIKRLEDKQDFSHDTVHDVIWDILHEPQYKGLDDTDLMDLEHETANIVKGKLS